LALIWSKFYGYSRFSLLEANPMTALQIFVRLLRQETGVTAIEYALVASIIGIAAFACMGTIGTSLSTIFTTVSADF